VTVVLAAAGFALGRDVSSLKPASRAGRAWLPTTDRGSVSQVDGISSSAGVEVMIGNGASGPLC
jgi:hypothetical protein